MSKGLTGIFLENVTISKSGWTDLIFIKDLIKLNAQFETKNGCNWARKGSFLDKNYNLKRFNAKELGITGVPWNKVVAIQLQGFKEKIENHSIPKEVRIALKDKPCVVLGVVTSDMEIDHKNGRYDSLQYTFDDFQPMSKAVNDAKREHCKRCNSTKIRFKATTLGYPVDFYQGDETSSSCVGCYWYDPIAFRQSLMKGVTNV